MFSLPIFIISPLVFNHIPTATSSIVGKLKSSAFHRLYRRVYRASLWVCAAADIVTCKYFPEEQDGKKQTNCPQKQNSEIEKAHTWA